MLITLFGIINREFENVLRIVCLKLIDSIYPDVDWLINVTLSPTSNGLYIDIIIPDIKSSKLLWQAKPNTATINEDDSINVLNTLCATLNWPIIKTNAQIETADNKIFLKNIKLIEMIPTSLVAKMMNLEEKEYFEAQQNKFEIPKY